MINPATALCMMRDFETLKEGDVVIQNAANCECLVVQHVLSSLLTQEPEHNFPFSQPLSAKPRSRSPHANSAWKPLTLSATGTYACRNRYHVH